MNLTAAGYVFLLDPWWNPAVEAQAVDRTPKARVGMKAAFGAPPKQLGKAAVAAARKRG